MLESSLPQSLQVRKGTGFVAASDLPSDGSDDEDDAATAATRVRLEMGFGLLWNRSMVLIWHIIFI